MINLSRLDDKTRGKSSADIHRCVISVPQAEIDSLRDRLDKTRPIFLPHFNEEHEALHKILGYWKSEYDWRKQEQLLNQFSHFQTKVDEHHIHFIHEKGETENATPLLLIHGFPDSFFRFHKVIRRLTHPSEFGGKSDQVFDVVIPSLPGYGFSYKPTKPGALFDIKDLFHKLMAEKLGYKKYGVHGGDWGSTITDQMSRSYSKHLIGIHLTDVPFIHAFSKPKNPTHAETNYLEFMNKWQTDYGAYGMIQGHWPFSLAQGLNDSPAGLAAWIVKMFTQWSDCDGDVGKKFSKDELLTNIMIYWVTQTIGSSFMLYHDVMAGPSLSMIKAGILSSFAGRVPTAFAIFPKDLSRDKLPREWAERFFDVRRFTKMPRGGHFAALEEPELLTQDIRDFFSELKNPH